MCGLREGVLGSGIDALFCGRMRVWRAAHLCTGARAAGARGGGLPCFYGPHPCSRSISAAAAATVTRRNARCVLGAGAVVNNVCQENDGRTPVFVAAANGLADVIEELVGLSAVRAARPLWLAWVNTCGQAVQPATSGVKPCPVPNRAPATTCVQAAHGANLAQSVGDDLAVRNPKSEQVCTRARANPLLCSRAIRAVPVAAQEKIGRAHV